ncbi:Aste57867_22407 [Aphanomyces stellatus]|uniref:Aste57867_22407 protein n=1 Tax=Aphanomyces stellatus TaxID=120398 RepID=A0A485LLC9_9STRA|nr:hypothetical protein As57867_022337 [Aphanomyces stellatus]VFT99070.1 Aste57867_22407 [Aphanomyces stellatus]
MPATTSQENDDGGGDGVPHEETKDAKDKEDVRQHIHLQAVVGRGAFSTVHAATFKGDVVAVKRQKKAVAAHYIERELSLLQATRHPRLLRHIASCECDDEVWIVSEYMAGGDVSQLLDASKTIERPLSWTECIQIALDAAAALTYLHSQGIIHRDIKSANLLLDSDHRCKLCDFGMARRTDIGSHWPKRRMSLCGTDAYMAPEMYCSEEYNERADVFSLGVVFVELICRRLVNTAGFLPRTPQQQFRIDLEDFRASRARGCPQSFSLLAESCIAFEADDRPTAQEILEWLESLASDVDDTTCDESAVEPAMRTMSLEHIRVVDVEDDNGGGVTSVQNAASPPVTRGTLQKKSSKRGLLFFRPWKHTHVVVDATKGTMTTFATRHEYERLQLQSDDTMAPDHTIPLRQCHLSRRGKCRFTLTTTSSPVATFDFQAMSTAECDRWVALLTHVMQPPPPPQNAHAMKAQPPKTWTKQIAPTNDDDNNADDDDSRVDTLDSDVREWLNAMQLGAYAPEFAAKGFHSLAFVRETGLGDDDFNFLGIVDPVHQARLAAAATALQQEPQH